MDWLNFVAFIVVALLVISRGGDAFDIAGAEADFRNWSVNVQFYAFFTVLCLFFIVFFVFVYGQTMKTEPRAPINLKLSPVAMPAKQIHPQHTDRSSAKSSKPIQSKHHKTHTTRTKTSH
jgi:hypothetical protein